MAFAFLPAREEDQPELAAFLAAAFRLPPDAPFLEARLLRWKFFEPRPGWEGSRSFVLKNGEAIVAHGCAWPVTFLAPTGEVTSLRIIDWAGSPAAPGAGVLLFRKFAGLAQTLLAVGGSEETVAILPKIGFRHAGDLALFAVPIRPWRQFRTRPERGWKAPLRLGRNWAWSRARQSEVPPGWSAVRVSGFAGFPAPRAARSFTPTRRDTARLNWLLSCPGAAFQGFEVRRRSELAGEFLLARVSGQTRIADLWVDSEAVEDWRAACALALRAAAEDPATCEVLATASVDVVRQAIRDNGLQPRGQEPIFLYDPQELLAQAPPLFLQLVDGDECFLSNPGDPYAT